MMTHIDISNVLRQTLACDLFSNLVTRPTGAAVRGQIEQMLSESNAGDVELTVIDFSHVSVIDFSCADEVIAKLLLRYAADDPPQEAYFVFRGVSEDHWAAIGTVLERHELALVIEREGSLHIAGVIAEDERRIWEVIWRLDRPNAVEIAGDLGAEREEVDRCLDALTRRRLVIRIDDRYVAVGSPRDR